MQNNSHFDKILKMHELPIKNNYIIEMSIKYIQNNYVVTFSVWNVP